MGTRNTLGDLNNHLFMQMERLNDDDLTIEELEKEKDRARAMSEISKNIINNANLVLQAKKFKDDAMDANADIRKLEG